MNNALKEKVGRNAVGEKCYEVYKDKKVQCENCPLKDDLSTGENKVIEAEGAFGGKTVSIMHKAIELRGEKYFLEIFEDITESITDELTGSFNRRKLREDLEEELQRAERYNNNLSVLMIDIDWFKEYNDFYGHQKGDELLERLVETISKNIRFNDRLYRYGGEEFVVLLPETDEKEAEDVAEKLRVKIGKKKFVGEKKSQPDKKITISIGIASYPKNGSSSREIIFAADSALYDAKASGRNVVKVTQKRD
jgi:diguanylate cyclase (GGDEF)-like protein